MNFSLNIFLLIFTLGTLQGLILSFPILFKKDKPAYARYFGFLLLLMSLASAKIILQELNPSILDSIAIPLLYKFAFGPLLYFFIRELLFPKTTNLKNSVPHFIPTFLFDFLLILGLPLLRYNNSDPEIQVINFYALNGGSIVYNMVYWVAAFKIYLKFKSVQGTKAKAKNRKIGSIARKILIIDFLGSIITIVFFVLTAYYQSYRFRWAYSYYIVYVYITFYIYFLSFIAYSLKDSNLFSSTNKSDKLNPARNYNTQQLRDIKSKIAEYEYYKDPDLNLIRLSEKLNIPSRELSEIINTRERKNINDFINDFRIDYFKKVMLNDSFSIEGLAYEAGFKSKASFYRAFKKSTGKTPSEFKKEMSLKS